MRKAFEKVRHLVLRKRRYRIVLATVLGSSHEPLDGDCSNPFLPGRIIRYHVGLKGRVRLDVLIHEMLHGCFWDVNEHGIEEAATDIARILWRFGFRNDDDLLQPDKDWPHYVTIRKKRYRFERVTGLPRGCTGFAALPTEIDKAVKIRISLRGEKELEGLLRALLMACYPDFDEEAVLETSKDISRALWRIGYRRTRC